VELQSRSSRVQDMREDQAASALESLKAYTDSSESRIISARDTFA
jgi:hypothetical protein